MNFLKTKINSKGQQFISAEEPVWEDGIKVATQIGFVEVNPAAADRKLQEFKDGKYIVSFGDKLPTGLYELQVVKAEVVIPATTGVIEHNA